VEQLHIPTTAITVNADKVAEMLAITVVDARSALADAKAAVEAAERAFKATGTESVVLQDGTKVALVRQQRRTLNTAILKDLLPKGRFNRVSRRVADMALVDGEIAAGRMTADEVAEAITVKDVVALKVTQPKQ
jgi:hypothetical protein